MNYVEVKDPASLKSVQAALQAAVDHVYNPNMFRSLLAQEPGGRQVVASIYSNGMPFGGASMTLYGPRGHRGHARLVAYLLVNESRNAQLYPGARFASSRLIRHLGMKLDRGNDVRGFFFPQEEEHKRQAVLSLPVSTFEASKRALIVTAR